MQKPEKFFALIFLGFLAFTGLPQNTVAQTIALIEIRDSPQGEDDFLCWSPVAARVKLAQPGPMDVPVTLRSGAIGPSAGVVGFMESDVAVTPSTFAPKKELPIVLKGDGSWVEFNLFGLKASDGEKDIAVRAELGDGSAIGQTMTMVRVRKDAEQLSPKERNNFLSVLAQWKKVPGLARPTRFEDFYTTHEDAFSKGIHSGFGANPSNFLPWHRAFLLNFERELQAIDQTVALPYWKFDAPAPQLFSAEFLGAKVPGTNEVELASTNPIRGWSAPPGQLLTRAKSASVQAPMNPGVLGALACTSANCPNIFRETTDTFEMNYHNSAHGFILGWLGGGASPKDPLFFLLHANVDRGWAHWQQARDRFDSASEKSYTPEGRYPGSVQNKMKEGLFAEDEMWPWGHKQGDWGTPGVPDDDWLPYRFSFPAAPGLPLSGIDFPTPAKMIDYMGVRGGPELGFCYDDMAYQGGKPSEVLEQVQ
ncbi:tyrosinase family protein [Rhizobium anhuiense]|uniref:tyrosinase family protein n=1 Tax=Rhizobium anhuiense TaxID=1184720 RepID=UPI0020CF2EC6|nr:tyrosinase family protein [Rhizobium anhuiense]UTS90333.1 tyrosinase family protein [Rhizobium anhuiense bv. trifolii]